VTGTGFADQGAGMINLSPRLIVICGLSHVFGH